jgi:hypothetical protein
MPCPVSRNALFRNLPAGPSSRSMDPIKSGVPSSPESLVSLASRAGSPRRKMVVAVSGQRMTAGRDLAASRVRAS